VEEAALPAKVKADMAKWCEARLKKIKELIIEAQ
jgi:hypothetical protein